MAEVNLLPAYLINGEDQLKRETVLKRLRSRLEAMGDLDFNCDTFDGKGVRRAEKGPDVLHRAHVVQHDRHRHFLHTGELLGRGTPQLFVGNLSHRYNFPVFTAKVSKSEYFS